MLWLDRPPVLRWAAAALLVGVAAWSEFAPPPSVQATFLAEDVPAGTHLEPHHVVARSVDAAFPDTVEPTGVAATDLRAGEPLLSSMITQVAIPAGWLVLEATVPSHATPGAAATGIVVGNESAPVEFPAVVVDVGSADPFGEASGTIAVPEEWVGPAAGASTEGRLVIGVASPDR